MMLSILVLCLLSNTPADAATPVLSTDIDVEQGARLARRCRSCHAMEVGSKKAYGPPLFDIMGRPIGSVPDYDYGPYLQAQSQAGAVWDERMLRRWLSDSKALARAAGSKTKMPSQKLDPVEMDQLLRYMSTLSSFDSKSSSSAKVEGASGL